MKRIIWLVLSSLIVLSLLLASCGGEKEEEEITIPETEEEVTVPEEEEEVTVPEEEKGPQYGDTFTYRITGDPSSFDSYRSTDSVIKLYLETMCMPDYTIDRDVWDFKIGYVPAEYATGMLAESWEVSPDLKTYTFNIRKGVQFQDLPPVNGRELTAYDVEYSWHRLLGKGSGFTEGSPYQNVTNYALVESITATDKYTVVFKIKEPSMEQLRWILDDHIGGSIVAREAVEKWGNLDDYKTAIGTGPFMLTDYVSASSMTAVKNPNYWGYDELYPENRLPYVDKVKMLIIPDLSTALAALRTGKIDLVEDISWEMAENLVKTNPELKQVTRPRWGSSITIMVDREPYNDIRVRKAMQMAIDIPTIAESYYGGTMYSKPMGPVGLQGYYTPFDEWPQEVKEGYLYNPEGAKQLLSEAGYPDGFKCTLTARSSDDLNLYEILQSYFADIGIDMEIEVFEPTVFRAYTNEGKHELCTGLGTIPTNPPISCLNSSYSKHGSYLIHHIQDAIYDELVDKAKVSLDNDEFRSLIIEADMRAITQQWRVNLPPRSNFCVYQPWLNRFNGEAVKPFGELVARFWIDQNLKKTMGY
jgi:peptide/nickel transport system substrate-binding protein